MGLYISTSSPVPAEENHLNAMAATTTTQHNVPAILLPCHSQLTLSMFLLLMMCLVWSYTRQLLTVPGLPLKATCTILVMFQKLSEGFLKHCENSRCSFLTMLLTVSETF